MEKNKFDDIVDQLLAPALKSRAAQIAKYKSADIIRHETTYRLQPRGELQPCGDCGDLVKNRVVEYCVYNLSRNPHWKKKCLECGEKSVVKGPIDKGE